MSIHQPIPPTKAIELVEFRKLDGADALLADFVAAGLIRTYALKREIRPLGGPTEMLRDAQIPPEDWERIVTSDNVGIALNGGTVRLEGSNLQGGTPSVLITGISFSEASLVKVLDRYCANLPAKVIMQPSTPNLDATIGNPSSASQNCESVRRQII